MTSKTRTTHTTETRRPATHAAPMFHGRNLGKIQRCSRPLCSSQATDEPTRHTMSTTTRHTDKQHPGGYTHDPMTRILHETLDQDPPVTSNPARTPKETNKPARDDQVPRPVASGPNSVLGEPLPQRLGVPTPRGVLASCAARTALRQCSTHEQPPQTRTAWAWPLPPAPTTLHSTRPEERALPAAGDPSSEGADGDELLRKEVIQPHLPVRLPCYDLVPIASPTFDHSLPQGVGP